MRKILTAISLFEIILLLNIPLVAEENTILEKGKIAPLFSLPTLSGKREMLSVWTGEKLSKPYLNDKKHTVILSFWATYCVPCKKEIPQLQEFYNKYKDKNIKVFLISIDSKGAAIVAPHVEKAGYTLPVLLDQYKRTADRYGVKSVPSLFVISKTGKIIYSAKGFSDDESLVKILEDVVFNSTVVKNTSVKTLPKTKPTEKPIAISPKMKWKAVASIECGALPDSIATGLGVTTYELKKWYIDIKKSAIALWGKQ